MAIYKDPISLFKQTNFSNTIWWKLKVNISAYQNETENKLVTEISKNRRFRILYPNIYKGTNKYLRILIQLYEDGYVCWINLDGLIIEKSKLIETQNLKYEHSFIKEKIPSILKWIQTQSELNNKYLWGGTLGPNFDCSGLIQTSFFKHNIYIPRDSYQIMNFCRHLFYFPGKTDLLKKGDLLFFGEDNVCNHVAIYSHNGIYYHSSGIENGRNGISKENLYESQHDDKISRLYRSKLICAGRVTRSYI